MAATSRKISALEAERLVQQALQYGEAQPCCSAKEAKSHRRDKLKAILDDLMSRFAVLEGEQQSAGTSRCELDGAAATPRSQHTEKWAKISYQGGVWFYSCGSRQAGCGEHE